MYYERNNRKSNITLYQRDNEKFLEDILKNDNIILVIDPPFNINYHYNEYKDNRKDYYDWFYQDQVKNVNKEKQNHPAQMPLEVMKRVIGVLPKNSIIVDIFMGSGTTGVACKDLGYDFIGVELNKEYFEIAKKRIEEHIPNYNLWNLEGDRK